MREAAPRVPRDGAVRRGVPVRHAARAEPAAGIRDLAPNRKRHRFRHGLLPSQERHPPGPEDAERAAGGGRDGQSLRLRHRPGAQPHLPGHQAHRGRHGGVHGAGDLFARAGGRAVRRVLFRGDPVGSPLRAPSVGGQGIPGADCHGRGNRGRSAAHTRRRAHQPEEADQGLLAQRPPAAAVLQRHPGEAGPDHGEAWRAAGRGLGLGRGSARPLRRESCSTLRFTGFRSAA
mmetsp:Transcript_7257/g.20572  ORF Transcript_7257/g.20572 Transcript_7257/m.20572 type:complete len:232 (-) Transcript_7257:1565-2260(-)